MPSPAVPSPPVPIAMHPGRRQEKPGPKELVERISESLLTLFLTLSSVNPDISLYHFQHTVEKIRRDPSAWNKLDEAYSLYEEQSNHCRRLWMKLRAASENETAQADGAGDSSVHGIRPLERSPSPLEYQSENYEDELGGIKREVVTPAFVDPVQVKRGVPRPPTPAVDPPPPKLRSKKRDAPTPRAVIVTPSGPTSSRLAPIPKGTKLSVETTRIPAPRKAFTFNLPRELIISDSERQPLNRKHNHPDAHSSQNTFSSLQYSGLQGGSSTAQTPVSLSPRRNYSSANEYWEPRRPIRSNDFQMDEDRKFNSLDCIGPPFHIDTAKITHNTYPATQSDLRSIYGVGSGLTPKLYYPKHNFVGWMIPNIDFHPFLPPQPGWPGLVLQLDDSVEDWKPEEGAEFRVVTKKEPRFVEYLGQYEIIRLGDLTGDEWKRQPAKVKNRWTQVLGGGQSWKEAVVRVALRKDLGREPSTEDFTRYSKNLTADNYTKLAKDLKDDIETAFCKGEEIIAVWGMKCVGYDWRFEKHLARSLKAIKPSLSASSKKRKPVTKGSGALSEDDEEGRRVSAESDVSPSSKRQRVAKGKAKLVRFDWSDANNHGDSQDEDYIPASS